MCYLRQIQSTFHGCICYCLKGGVIFWFFEAKMKSYITEAVNSSKEAELKNQPTWPNLKQGRFRFTLKPIHSYLSCTLITLPSAANSTLVDVLPSLIKPAEWWWRAFFNSHPLVGSHLILARVESALLELRLHSIARFSHESKLCSLNRGFNEV